jgi:glycosyltransferase involved in cell wall biosynthesis
MKKVSVVTVTYNQENLIEKCLQGIVNQKTNFDFEIIVGDDASTDSTLTKINEFAHQYPNKFKIHTAQTNNGLQYNLHRCLEICEGEYIAICDGDDYWIDENKLQKQVDFLDNNTEFGLVGTAVQYYDEDKQVLKPIEKKYSSIRTFTTQQIFCSNPFTASTVLFRKTFFDAFLDLKNNNLILNNYLDYSIWMFIAIHSKTAILPDITTVYRLSESNISQTKNYKKLWEFKKRFYEHLHFLKGFYSLEKVLNFKKINHCKAKELYKNAVLNNEVQIMNEFEKTFIYNFDCRFFLSLIKNKRYFAKSIDLYEKVSDKLTNLLSKCLICYKLLFNIFITFATP